MEPMGRRAKVESRAWRFEEELRDPHARVELMIGKVDLCSWAEPLEEPSS